MGISSFNDWNKNKKGGGASAPSSGNITSFNDWLSAPTYSNVNVNSASRARTQNSQTRYQELTRNRAIGNAQQSLANLVGNYINGANDDYAAGAFAKNREKWNKQYTDLNNFIDQHKDQFNPKWVQDAQRAMKMVYDTTNPALPKTSFNQATKTNGLVDDRGMVMSGDKWSSPNAFDSAKGNAGTLYAKTSNLLQDVLKRADTMVNLDKMANNLSLGDRSTLNGMSNQELANFADYYNKTKQGRAEKINNMPQSMSNVEAANAQYMKDQENKSEWDRMDFWQKYDYVKTQNPNMSEDDIFDYIDNKSLNKDYSATTRSALLNPAMYGSAADALTKELDRRNTIRPYAEMFNNKDFKANSGYDKSLGYQDYNDLKGRSYGDLNAQQKELLFYDAVNGNKQALDLLTYNRDRDGMEMSVDPNVEQYMTKEEVSNFNYLYRTQGKDKAMEYYKLIEDDLNGRYRDVYNAQIAEDAKDPLKAIGMSAWSVLNAPFAAIGNIVGMGADLITGDHTIHANDPKYTYGNEGTVMRAEVGNAIREAAGGEGSFWGDVAKFGYDTSMSVLDNLYGMGTGAVISNALGLSGEALNKTTEAITLGIMGTNSAATSIYNNVSAGMDTASAVILGFGSGAIEVLTEKIGLDNLFESAWRGKGAWSSWVKQVLSEGGEEVLGAGLEDALGLVYDTLSGTTSSEFGREVNAYILEHGLAPNDRRTAEMAVLNQHLLQYGVAGLAGAASGGTMGGGATAIATVDHAMSMNDYINANNSMQFGDKKATASEEILSALFSEAYNKDRTSKAGNKAFQIAQDYKIRQTAGETLTNKDAARMYGANLRADAETEMKRRESALPEGQLGMEDRRTSAAVQEALANNADGETVREIVNAIEKGESLSEQTKRYLSRDTINKISPEPEAPVNVAPETVYAEQNVQTPQPRDAQAQTLQRVDPIKFNEESRAEIVRQKFEGRSLDLLDNVLDSARANNISTADAALAYNEVYVAQQKGTQANVPPAIIPTVIQNQIRQQAIKDSLNENISAKNETEAEMEAENADFIKDLAEQYRTDKMPEVASALAAGYKTGTDVVEYGKAIDTIVSEAQNGVELQSIMLPGNIVNNDIKQAVYNAALKEANNGGEISVSGISGGNNLQDTGITRTGMVEEARRAQNERRIEEQSKRKVEINQLKFKGQKISTFSQGFTNGTQGTQLFEVDLNSNEDTREAAQVASKYGFNLTGVAGGSLTFNMNGQVIKSRGVVEGNKISARADHKLFRMSQLVKHEVFHKFFEKDTRNRVDTLINKMDQAIGSDNVNKILNDYLEIYDGSGLTADEVAIEMLCDMNGSMNFYAEHFKDQLAKVDWYENILEKTSKVTQNALDGVYDKAISNGDAYGIQFSRDVSDSKAIVAVALENLDIIPKKCFDVVGDSNETIQSFEKKSDYIMSVFDRHNNVAFNKELGGIDLIRFGADSTIAHGFGRLKLTAVKAIVPTIENGVIVSTVENYKGKGYTRYVISAIGSLDGQEAIVSVSVNKYTNPNLGNRFYLHEASIIKTDSTIMPEKDEIPTAGAESVTNNSIMHKDDSSKKNFSMELPVEESGNLIALHNLTADKLKKTLALGGFPMPSIAVTKADIPHSNFGDITLVMNKNTIDPKANKKNDVFSADAWTPTVPDVEYEADDKVNANLRNLYYEVNKKFGRDIADPFYSVGNDLEATLNRYGGPEGVIENLKNNVKAKNFYLAAEYGSPIDPVEKTTVKRMDEKEIRVAERITDIAGNEFISKLANVGMMSSWMKKHPDVVENIVRKYCEAVGLDNDMTDSFIENAKLFDLYKSFLKPAIQLYKNGPETSTVEVDTEATNKAINDAVNQEEYEKWLNDIFDGAVKDSGVYNNKDIYTASGNRRSFKQTHFPNTLEGIVKAMASQNGGNSKNVSGFHGVKTLRAGTAKRFSSIAEMHKYEGRLQNLTDAETEKINDALGARLSEIMGDIYNTKSHSSYDNSFFEMDSIGEVLGEVAESGNYDENNIQKIFNKYSWNIDNGIATSVKELLFDISQMPVNIFEAKPARAVGFNEVLAAILPSDVDASVREQLMAAGVQNIISYESGNESDRLAKVNSVPDAKFSREIENTQVKSVEELETAVADLKERVIDLKIDNKNLEFERDKWRRETQLSALTKGSAAYHNQTPLISSGSAAYMARGMIKRYGSTIDYKEIAPDIQKWVTYLASHAGEADTFAKVNEGILPIAKKLVENAQEIVENDGSKIKAYIKKSTIKISPSARNDIQDYTEWRKAHFGKMNVSLNKGIAVSDFADELYEQFGTSFDIRDMGETDQILAIAEFVDTYAPITQNPYSYNMAEAIQGASLEIYNDMLNAKVFNPTYADKSHAAIEQLEKSNSERIARIKLQARQETWKRVQEAKDHAREVATNARMRRQDADLKKQLLKLANRADKLKTNHANKAAIQALIQDLDLTAVNMSAGKAMDLKSFVTWADSMAADNPDFFINQKVYNEALHRLNSKKIGDMNINDVKAMIQSIRVLLNDISHQNKLIRDESNREVRELAGEISQNIENSRGMNGGIHGKLDNMLVKGTLSPVRFIHRLTGYVDTDPLYQATAGENGLAGGQRKMLSFQQEANDMFSRWTEDRKFTKDITGTKATVLEKDITTIDGKTTKVRLTKAMRMSLYMHSLNDDSMKHMCGYWEGPSEEHPNGRYVPGGGFLLPNMDTYKKGRLSEAYTQGTQLIKCKKSELLKLTEGMSEQELAFCRKMKEYFGGMSQNEINKVSEDLVGISLAEVKNYFPISVNRNFLGADYGAIKMDGTIEGMGMLKERISSTTPIDIMDATSVLQKSIESTSKYVGLAIPIRNMNKLLGVKFARFMENGTYIGNESSVLREISEKWGEKSKSYIDKMLSDLQSGSKSQEDLEKMLGKLRSGYAGAVLTWNLSVAMKQAASYPTAAGVLGWLPLVKAMGKFGHVDLELIKKYTPLQAYRTKGFSTAELGDIQNQNNFFANLPKGLNWIQGVDLITTRKLWKASEIYVQDNNKNLRVGSDAFYKAVAEIYNQCIEETQPNYTALQRPEYLRSNSGLVQTLMMFKTQPMQNFNVLYDGIWNYKAKRAAYMNNQNDQTRADLKNAKTKLSRAITSQVGQLVTFAAMTMLWNFLRRKKDKYKDEEGNVTALSIAEGLGKDMLSGAAGMVPFGSDVYNLFASVVFGDKYYGFESVTDSALSDLGDSVINFSKLINSTVKDLKEGGWEFDNYKKNFKGLASSISKLAGIPFDNVANLIDLMFENSAVGIGKVTGNEAYMDYIINRWKLNPAASDQKKTFTQNLYDMYKEGDEHYDDVHDFLESRYGEKSLEENMQKRFLEDKTGGQNVSPLYDDLYSKWDTDEYDSAVEEALNFGFTEDTIASGIKTAYARSVSGKSDATQADAYANLLDLYNSKSPDYNSEYKKMLELGFTDDNISDGINKILKEEQGVTHVKDLKERYYTPAQAEENARKEAEAAAKKAQQEAEKKRKAEEQKKAEEEKKTPKSTNVSGKSSWIANVEYTESTGKLVVYLKNGRTYTHEGVSKSIYDEMTNGDPGRTYNKYFK